MRNAKETIKSALLKTFFSDTYREYRFLKKTDREFNQYKQHELELWQLSRQKELELSQSFRQQELKLRQYTQTVEEMYRKSENQLVDINKTLNLIKTYTAKHLDETAIEKYTYRHIYKCMDINFDLFKETLNEVYKINIQSIKRKNKIKISFLAVTASTWSCDSLYKKLISDGRFDTNIIVTPFLNGTLSTINEIYCETKNFFDEKGYKNIGIYNEQTDKYLNFEEVGSPDVLFHLNPHTCCIPENFKIDNLPLNLLNVYIPYGIMTFGMTDMQYNQMSHHLYWKIFCESELHKEMARKYSIIGDNNVEVSGYLKMDAFLDGSLPKNILDIWKVGKKDTDSSKICKRSP